MKSVYSPAVSCLSKHTATAGRVTALSLILALAACSSNVKTEDDPGPAPATQFEDDSSDANKLFIRARSSLEKGQYESAVLQYENLEATYPFGDHAAQARLDTAYAYYQQGELNNALATLDRYLKLYPQAEEADYAYYMKGLVNYSRGKSLFESLVPRKLHQLDQAWLRSAASDFSTLTQKYPDSEFVEDAKARGAEVRDQMARHELSTAQYYFNRSAMIAAINRINFMIEQYPDSSLTADGLALLARAHRALGNQQSADEATTLLRSKYPEFTKI